MIITLEQMKKLHDIQLQMFCELNRVMEELGIRYFFVHGSLLSAVTSHHFIAEDDDIDIAVFRKDYDRLLQEGNKFLSAQYFIQSSKNDDFPLSFAKLRKHHTEFYQPILGKYQCNNGIYIDIFPIDFEPQTEGIVLKWKRRLLNARINSRLQDKCSVKQKLVKMVSLILYPSYRAAVNKREALYASVTGSEYVSIFGGKASEQRMPYCWFEEEVKSEFCGIEVTCPKNWDAYLTRIYGQNYLHKNPAENRILTNKGVEVSASFIDFGDNTVIGCKDHR